MFPTWFFPKLLVATSSFVTFCFLCWKTYSYQVLSTVLFSSFLAEIVTAILTFMTWLWISNLSIASFLGVFKMRQARDPGSAWVWVSLHVCFPFNRSLLLFCRTSSIKVNQFNIFQYNYSISLYHHIMSFHVISYLPSCLAYLTGWLSWLACVTTSDAGRCFYLSHGVGTEINWDNLSRCRFLRQELEWNTLFFYPTIWRVRRCWRSGLGCFFPMLCFKSEKLPGNQRLAIGVESHSWACHFFRRPWTTWHVVDWRGHASMLCLLWRPGWDLGEPLHRYMHGLIVMCINWNYQVPPPSNSQEPPSGLHL